MTSAVHERGHFHGQDVKIQQFDSTHSNPMVPKRCGENVGKENRKTLVERTLRGFRVPGAGIEPARIAPLVFETSASTDSAIRAGCCFICSVSGLWVRRSGFDW